MKGATVPNPLATLGSDPLHLDKVENVQCGPGQELTLFDKTGPGVVKSLWMALAGGGNPCLDGRIRAYYDGSTTPALDADVGTLFATHWGGGTNCGSHNTPHAHVEINVNDLTTGLLLTFPMPYGQRIRIT